MPNNSNIALAGEGMVGRVELPKGRQLKSGGAER
jgi:hypothetical protein